MGAMFFVVHALLTLCLVEGQDTSMWMNHFVRPIPNCRGEDIDLLLVADVSGNLYQSDYKDQTKFFSKLVDVFSSPSETNLERLRVAMVTFSFNTAINVFTLESSINFDTYKTKHGLKTAIESSKVPDFSNATSLDSLAAIYKLVFMGNEYGSRPDARHVTVMLIQEWYDISQENAISENRERTLGHPFYSQEKTATFLIITTAPISSLLMNHPNHELNFIIYKVDEKTTDDLIKNISRHLCMQCDEGWFTFVSNSSTNIYRTGLSCYKRDQEYFKMNWLDAYSHADKKDSLLVSLETPEEYQLVREFLISDISKTMRQTNMTRTEIKIYIGLSRNKNSYGGRFRWMSEMPLIYTRWGKSHPMGGSIFACAVWAFDIDLESQVEGNDPPLHDNITDVWQSVGCGVAQTKNLVLEKVYDLEYTISRRYQWSMHIPKPSKDSVQEALRRGDLAYNQNQNMLISVAHALTQLHISDQMTDRTENVTIISNGITQPLLITKIPMFSCGSFMAQASAIPYSQVCNYRKDCPDGSDESCNFAVPQSDYKYQFVCASKQVVPKVAKCDLHPDCLDGSDENECWSCPHHRCPDGKCLPEHWLGDGEVDCDTVENQDSVADEVRYANDPKVTQCVFTCNRTKCIYMSMLNDGVVDCRGPEGPIDETIGALISTSCISEMDTSSAPYANWAPKCVYIKDYFGEPLGCRDMSHLQSCENFTCPTGYTKCPQSYCIPIHYINNQQYECAYGEDEERNDAALTERKIECNDNFQCSQHPTCVHPDLVCDGHEDCLDGSDEELCNMTCKDGFLCVAGTLLVDNYNKMVPLKNLAFVDPRTRYTDLSGVDLSEVFPNNFASYFKSTVHARFSGCKIKSVQRNYSQFDMGLVRVLDLSYNFITSIQYFNVFQYMPNLVSLNLSHNPLQIIEDRVFYPLPMSRVVLGIQQLDLSYTSVTQINIPVFRSLRDLAILKLQNTPLTKLQFNSSTELRELDIRNTRLAANLYPDMFKNVTISIKLETDSFKLCCPQLHNEMTKSHVCHSTTDPFSSCFDLMSNTALRVLLWADGVLSVVGNISVIVYRLCFDRQIFQMAYGHFVTHLSISDLVMGSYLLNIGAADAVFRGAYVWVEWGWRNNLACKLAGFLSTLSTEVSTIFIFLITLDRYLVIRFPFGQYKISGKITHLCSVVAWTVGSLLAAAPLLPIFEMDEVYSSNGLCLAFPLSNKRYSGWQYAMTVFVFLNFFLFLFIAYGQWAIYRTMCAMRLNQAALSSNRSRRLQDMTVAKNLSLVVITNFLCWCPVGVMGFMGLMGYELAEDVYAWTAVLILPINSAINPLLYTIPGVFQKLKKRKDSVSSDNFKGK